MEHRIAPRTAVFWLPKVSRQTQYEVRVRSCPSRRPLGIGVLLGDQIVTPRGATTVAVEIKVSLAIFGFGDRSHQGVGQTEV